MTGGNDELNADLNANRRYAEQRVTAIGRLLEATISQNQSSNRWYTGSLLIINGAAAVAIISADIASGYKIGANGAFVTGVVASLLSAKAELSGLVKMSAGFSKMNDYWSRVVASGIRDASKESSDGSFLNLPVGEEIQERRRNVSLIAFVVGSLIAACGFL